MIQRTPLRRSAKPITRKRSKPRRGRIRDEAYLEWVRMQPCCIQYAHHVWSAEVGLVVFRQMTKTEAAHCGARGLGQKCDDTEAIPLCKRHHRTGLLAHHVLGKKFWAYHGLDRCAIIAELQERYEKERVAC